MSKTLFTRCAAATALLISAASVARSEQGLIVHKALSLDMAMAMTQGSLAKCRELHYKCAVTVLDATGRTIIALQDDGANLHRFDVSRKKAYTALVYRKPSREVVEGWSKKTAEPVPLLEGTVVCSEQLLPDDPLAAEEAVAGDAPFTPFTPFTLAGLLVAL